MENSLQQYGIIISTVTIFGSHKTPSALSTIIMAWAWGSDVVTILKI
jgi:hypothetical protein